MMSLLYFIIPLSIVLVVLIVWMFLRAVRSGQFDDMEGPANHKLRGGDDKDNDVTLPKAVKSRKVKDE